MTQEKINAYILKKNNSKLKLVKDLYFPKLKKGQILVELIYTTVCGSQIMEIKGKRGRDKYLPHGLGHEGTAKVIKTASDVKKVKKKDKIILTWIKSRGNNCGGIKIKDKKNKKYNFGPITTFSNFSIISENRCVKKPKGLSDELAAFFGCSISTGFGVVYNTIPKKKSNISIGIFGLGSVGFFSLIAAKCLRLKNIFVFEKDPNRKKIAKKLGAQIINIKNAKREILKKNNNRLLDYCYESAGYAKTIEKAFDLINLNGKCFTTSHPAEKEILKINPHELIKGKKIFGSWGGYTQPETDFVKFTRILNKNRKYLRFLKNKKYNFNQLNDAIFDFSKNKIIKPLIKC